MNTLKPSIFALLFLVPLLLRSQDALEPYIGCSIDLADKQSFGQLNIGLQYPVISDRVYQMLIRVQAGIPLNRQTGNDVAYTSDPLLPLNVATGYKAGWYSAGFIIGNRFRLISWADKNTISPFVNAGIIYQKIAVSYDNYDREKYTVLNPHRSLKKTRLCIGSGIQYKRDLGNGAVFLQTEFLFSPVVNHLNNYNYQLPVPLSINAGYVIKFKKRGK